MSFSGRVTERGARRLLVVGLVRLLGGREVVKPVKPNSSLIIE